VLSIAFAQMTDVRIYHAGNRRPGALTYVVALPENELGREAVEDMLPMQPADVTETFADVAWVRDHYKV
jgi:UDP-glucuronate 4-epimerase